MNYLRGECFIAYLREKIGLCSCFQAEFGCCFLTMTCCIGVTCERLPYISSIVMLQDTTTLEYRERKTLTMFSIAQANLSPVLNLTLLCIESSREYRHDDQRWAVPDGPGSDSDSDSTLAF